MKKKSERHKFEHVIGQLLRVSHTELKAKLDAEKRAKQKKRKGKEK